MKFLPGIALLALISVALAPLQAAPKNLSSNKPNRKNVLKTDNPAKKKSIKELKAIGKKIKKDMAKVQLIPEPDVDIKDDPAELEKAAENGDVQAMINLGHYHMMHFTPDFENEKKAGEYFSKAADTGDADAKAWLALYHWVLTPLGSEAQGYERLYSESIDSAREGSVLGAYLAAISIIDKGLDDKKAERRELLESAARKGFIPAMRAYADQLDTLHNQEPDTYAEQPNILYEDARAWMELAAKAGDLHAAYYLAFLRNAISGLDVAGGEKTARKVIAPLLEKPWRWYDGSFSSRFLCERGHYGGERMHLLLQIYADLHSAYGNNGLNPEPLRKELVSLLEKRAKKGEPEALAALITLDRRWLAIFRGAPLPALVKEADYLPALEKLANDGNMRALILLRACQHLSRLE